MTKTQMLLTIIFLLLTAITFSPIVMPYNISEPWLFSMPRTLWAGILISFLFAFLTLIAALTLETKDENQDIANTKDVD